MSDFFKDLPIEKRRTHRYEFRLTQKEFDKIKQRANIHQLSTSEFVRRASLARRADIHDQAQIVQTLINVTSKLRAMSEAMSQRGLLRPEKALRETLDEAMSAVLRISK